MIKEIIKMLADNNVSLSSDSSVNNYEMSDGSKVFAINISDIADKDTRVSFMCKEENFDEKWIDELLTPAINSIICQREE